MNKLLKGAVAGAAGIALLLGGAGTFAAWNDSNTISANGDQISTGSLQFVGQPTSTGWFPTLATAQGGAAADKVDASKFLLVPGDTLYYRASVVIAASGTNLHASFTINPSDVTAALGDKATATGESVTASVYSVTPDTTGAITGGTNGVYTVHPQSGNITATVLVEVDFPFGDLTTTNAGKTGQNTKLTLSDIPVSLTQTQAAN